MASANTVLKKLINVNGVVVESYSFFTDIHDVKHLRIQVRPNKWHQKICPFCGRRCPGYDQPARYPKRWRGLDLGSILVEIESQTQRISCPEHGTVTACLLHNKSTESCRPEMANFATPFWRILQEPSRVSLGR